MVGPRGETRPFRRPKTRFSNTLFHHKPQGAHPRHTNTSHNAQCTTHRACARVRRTALLQLRTLISPLYGRCWPSGLHYPNGNRRENTIAAGTAALRAFPHFQKSRTLTGYSTHSICAVGCCAQAGCDSDAPRGDITSAVARAVATSLPHVCVPAFPWSCVGPTGPAKRCSVCDPGELMRPSERDLVSLGVRGCSLHPYGPFRSIGNNVCEKSVVMSTTVRDRTSDGKV